MGDQSLIQVGLPVWYTLDKVMFALVNVGEIGILGKQPHANLSFSG